ncbi:tetraspanin-31 [Hyalella azteca]|uniref:Tetraspanin-31 n=1 Tax=Hyalella azteca TaxID=294128 RepID=A0A8B7NDW4_HYAAZ|nr:tetraspanin-31 [Hyalella azteca]
MCGSFTCSKNSLIALNIVYVLVAILLIGVAGAAKYTAIVTSLAIVSGIIACGVFLLMISTVGLIAASRHHQVLLFFYMIVLFIIFVIQFGVACACLAINENQQEIALNKGWSASSDELKREAQMVYNCCGYDSLTNSSYTHPECTMVKNDKGVECCPGATAANCCTDDNSCQCPVCKPRLMTAIGQAFSAVGGVGLFFSFSEILGFFIARTYRHQINPYVSSEESRLQ